MIGLRNPLAVLATRMRRAKIDAALVTAFTHSDRAARVVQDADLFGPRRNWPAPGSTMRDGRDRRSG
jgi:hypothetical protein